MPSRKMWSRTTLLTAQMITISQFHRWLLDHTIERLVALAQLHHSHHRQTPLYLLFLSG